MRLYAHLRHFDQGSGRSLWMTQTDTGLAWCVALVAGGQLLASAGEDGIMQLWDVEKGAVLPRS